MDEGRARLLLDIQSGGIGVVIGPLHQADLGPQLLRRLDLADGRAVGHTDEGLDAVVGGGHGHALGVVAGAARQNAVGLFFVRELADLIVSAPELEAARLL